MDSWLDRLRLWLFQRFHQDIVDLSQDKYTQGFSDGYKAGWDMGEERLISHLDKYRGIKL